MDELRRGFETCNLLAWMADGMASDGTRITPRQMAALDCWHRLFGYPADRAGLPTFAELLTAATEEIAPTGRPVTDRARAVLALGVRAMRQLIAEPVR
jgi:hypothetical protein